MRELKTADIFKMSRMLKKMDLKIEDAEDKGQDQIGAEIILQVGENLHLIEKEVNEFMGSLIGIPAKEFADLSIRKTLEYYEEFKELPGINDFFKLAGQLNKKMT